MLLCVRRARATVCVDKQLAGRVQEVCVGHGGMVRMCLWPMTDDEHEVLMADG